MSTDPKEPPIEVEAEVVEAQEPEIIGDDPRPMNVPIGRRPSRKKTVDEAVNAGRFLFGLLSADKPSDYVETALDYSRRRREK